MKKFWIIPVCISVLVLAAGCVTQKKKGEDAGWFKKGYNNLTAKYNYWFNSNELLNLTTAKLESQHKDNFNQLLEVYPAAAADPQSVRGDLDNVIKKAAMAIALHRVSNWTDDCYTLMGQGQYLKRDYETAEATFKYIREEYNPNKGKKSKLKKASAKEKKLSAKKKKKLKKKAARKKKAEKKKLAKAKKKAKKRGKPVPKADTKTTTTKPAEPAAKPADATAAITGNNPYEKGLGPDAAYPKAMIWYGRTFTDRDKFEEADFLYRELHEDPFLPEDLKDDLAMAETYLWMKQKRYDRAIDPLVTAIALTKEKAVRARLSFLLAQLYDRAGRHEEAAQAYENVLKNNPNNYDLEFNARLQQVRSGWANNEIPGSEANRSLEKLAKDQKNAEYRDQIYFVMAEIALKEKQKREAVGLLRQSLTYNSNNVYQRTEAYYKLANLYFEAEDFVNAKSYFDSTLTVLQPTDPRHKEVTEYADNLNDIARLLTTITTNDSIIRVFNMSADEKKELARKIKKERSAASALAANTQITPPGGAAPPPVAGNKSSNFYFYNEAFLKKGKKDFSRVWGDRKLEDNWRRKSRPQTASALDPIAADSSAAGDLSERDLDDIFQGIPKSEAELSVLHASNYESLYRLGTLFRDKLTNYKRSAQSLEDAQSRYPDTARYEKEIWYYAYLDYTDLNNPEKAKYYYDKLTEKYPNSAYARALTDPNFLNLSKDKEKEVNNYYQETYSMFSQGQYQNVLTRCEDAPRRYGSTNPLMPKFTLLSALAVGNLQGNDAYCQALNDMIGRYPQSGEATRAKEIARLLNCKGYEVAETKKPEDHALPIDEAFTREDEKLHYFLIVFSDPAVKMEEVKNAVSDYNRENHRQEQIRISNIFLGTDVNVPILVLRKFDNRDQAMKYFEEVKDNKDFLGETEKKKYKKEFLAITQENYRRVVKNRTLDGYREFFMENYLKK